MLEDAHFHETIFQNHWLQAFYGWIVYQFYLIIHNFKKIDKNKDGKLSRSELWEYWSRDFWSMIFGLICIPGGVVLLPTLLKLNGYHLFEYAYIFAGITAVILQWYVKRKIWGK